MFEKLKKKLKSWTKKVSEKETLPKEKKKDKSSKNNIKKNPKEKRKSIEDQLKEELETGNYIEPIKKFVNSTQDYQPDLDKIKDEYPQKIPTEKKDTKTIIDNLKKKQPFFKKIISSKKIISEEQFDRYSEDLEMILLENNVAFEISEKIIKKLKEKITGREFEKKEIEKIIKESLKTIIEEILIPPFDLLEEIKKENSPYIILFCGINGTGKTTSISKIANLLKQKKISSVLAAGDTFRAASIEQLKKHGENLNIKVIAHQYGSDPASVGFDAIKYAKKNKIDVVLIDTAGRIHTATNLLREMEKIKRVCNPNKTLFVGESITGNDAVDQVKSFNEIIGIDGIILSKADIDEKGGTALSVGYITKKPIIFLGTGQEYEDIELFDKKKFIEKLGL